MRKTGAELTSCYVGVTEKLIADAFETAQRDGALLLLDEVDSFLRVSLSLSPLLYSPLCS